MTDFDVVKLFNLCNAPDEIRNASDLAVLRTVAPDGDSTILSLKVGEFDTKQEGPLNDCYSREVTWSEYRLHCWLTEHGAKLGENVFVHWKSDDSVSLR